MPETPVDRATRPRVLFVSGLGRSGTTLVERMLGQVEGVQTLGETVHLWVRGIQHDELCGCGRSFAACPFWSAVGRLAFDGWSRVDVDRVETLRSKVDRLRSIPSSFVGGRGALSDYVSHYTRLYAAAATVSGASLLVDSSKHPSMAYCLRRADIDLRVLHMVRDPRAVAHSWNKTVRRPDSTGPELRFMTRYPAWRTGLLWDAENVATSALRPLDVPVLRLRYESLTDAPERALRDVLRFAGLPDDVALPIHDRAVELHSTHTVSGNPMRLVNGPVAVQRDDGWRSGLSARDRRLVAAVTWPIAARYGYRLDG